MKNLIDSSLSSSGYNPTITIRDKIENGDRLRVMYKGENDSEWSYARRSSDSVTDEVLLCVSAESIAKNITIEYDKTNKSLTFTAPYAIQCSVYDSAGEVVASSKASAYNSASVDFSNLPSCEYKCSFSSNGDPYTIKLKF